MGTPEDFEKKVAPLLVSLAEFTEQREQEALTTSLGHAIRDLTDAKVVTLIRLVSQDEEAALVPVAMWQRSHPDTLREGLPPTALLINRPDFQQCFTSLKVTTVRDGVNTNLILPLCSQKDKVDAFYLVECLCSDEIASRVLPLLLEIYRNFLDLLRDNQHDLLTGLLNRKTFDTRINTILLTLGRPPSRRTDQPSEGYCLAIIDIDFFKRINDNFGHLYGDEVLLLMANMMKESFRDGDALFRFGGEEFVVLIRNVDILLAHMVLDRFRAKVEQRNFPQVGQVTVSCGFTQIHANELAPQIIDRADRALYYAKGHGRNQVNGYETLVELGELQAAEISTGDIELF